MKNAKLIEAIIAKNPSLAGKVDMISTVLEALFTYTSEPPTEPGWYWLRTPHHKPYPAEVYDHVTLGLVVKLRHSMYPQRVAGPGGEWAGPIPR